MARPLTRTPPNSPSGLPPRLLIDERFDEQGVVRRTFLQLVQPVRPVQDDDRDTGEHDRRPDVVLIVEDDHILGALPVSVVAAVMGRYGRPLDRDIAPIPPSDPDQTRVDLGGDRRLETLRFRARVDASSRDYLIWRAADQPALAALSRTIASALRHLAASLARRRASGPPDDPPDDPADGPAGGEQD